MKKIWVYISTFLLGVIGGIIIALKGLSVDKVIYNIKKLRARDGGSITVESKPINLQVDKKSKRKQRRESRKNK